MSASSSLEESEILACLSGGKRIRRDLGEWGRLYVERPVPYLIVFRLTETGRVSGGASVVTSEAAWLTTQAKSPRGVLRQTVSDLARPLRERFDAFLVVEVWIGPQQVEKGASPAAFTIVRTRRSPEPAVTEIFKKRLERISIARKAATVEVLELPASSAARPKTMPMLLSREVLDDLNVHQVGLEISPSFIDAKSKKVAPLRLTSLRRQLSGALRWLIYSYAEQHGASRQAAHVHAVGPQRLRRAARDVDAALSEIAGKLTFVLQATPTNGEAAWRRWKKSGDPGRFEYRPLTNDPFQLKRELHAVPIERVSDPTLHHIFRAVQLEIDRKLSMLIDLGTSRYLHGSLALYGGVEPEVLEEARRLLAVIPPKARGTGPRKSVPAAELVELAQAEVEYYRAQHASFGARVELRNDIASDLICSQGHLLIDTHASTPANRVTALLQHEVGTHLVTYYNGLAQPLQLLSRGLPGAVDLQEGLAVLSEFLAGGLQAPRMRVLAARVVAVHDVIQGSTMPVTTRLLEEHGLDPRIAFKVAVRAHRGGGLTKDAAYFRGLRDLLAYLAQGGELETLFLGKVALVQLPLLRELQQRKILNPPRFRPRYLDQPDCARRLAWLRTGVSVVDLLGAPCG